MITSRHDTPPEIGVLNPACVGHAPAFFLCMPPNNVTDVSNLFFDDIRTGLILLTR